MTTENEPTKKTRRLIVVKKPGGPRRSLLLTRRLRSGDDLDVLQPSKLHHTAPMGIGYDQEGNLISRTVLSATDFEEIEQLENAAEQVAAEETRTVTTRSRRSSKPPSAAETAAEIAVMEPLAHRDTYLSTLRVAHEKSQAFDTTLRMSESSSSVVVGERLKQEQPSKVLTLWQQRQREWEQIQAQIAKATNKHPEQLLTTLADQHRLKLEEYDTLQAAMANSEEFNQGATWEMQLRGGGERFIRIGNVFSGLYRPVHNKVKPPPQVRRPGKLPSMNITAKLQNNKSLIERKQRLTSKYEQIRPHEVVDSDMDSLMVVAIPLFLWAEQSSIGYFDQVAQASVYETKTTRDTSAMNKLDNKTLAFTDDTTRAAGSDSRAENSHLHLTLQLLSQPQLDVLRDGKGGEDVVMFSFQNTSPIAVSFRVATKTPASFDWRSLDNLPHALRRPARDQPFVCRQHTGCARPGEIVHIPFACMVHPLDFGAFSQEWTFTTEPAGAVATFHINSSGSGRRERELITPFTLTTRAICIRHLYYDHRRLELAQSLEKIAVANWMQELVLSCVRRVRQPVTDDVIRKRQLAAFKQCNDGFYQLLAHERGVRNLRWQPTIFVTTSQFDELSRLSLKLSQLRAAVLARRQQYEDAHAQALNGNVPEAYSLEVIRNGSAFHDKSNFNGSSTSKLSRYVDHELDVFDSVTPAVYENNWSANLTDFVKELSDVRQILEILSEAEPQMEKRITNLMREIAKRRRLEQKELRKQKRREKRRRRRLRKQRKKLTKKRGTGGGQSSIDDQAEMLNEQENDEESDDEQNDEDEDEDGGDEEEEEEEEEEDDEEDSDEPSCKASVDSLTLLPYADQLVQEFLTLEAETWSTVATPLMTTLPSAVAVARSVALEIVEAVMHTEQEAATLANLKEKAPVMPNPFDPAQKEAFETMLQNGRNPPKKVIPADVFHASWYDSALKVVSDTTVRGWTKQHEELRAHHLEVVLTRKDILPLHGKCGVVRQSDVSSKAVVLHTDLSVFRVLGEADGDSAGNIASSIAETVTHTRQQAQRSRVVAAVQEILSMGAKHIVCVCEPWRWDGDHGSFEAAAGELAKQFSDVSTRYCDTLADAAAAVEGKETTIVILRNINVPSIHPPIPEVLVEESDDEDEALPATLREKSTAASAITPEENEAASWLQFFRTCNPCTIVEDNIQGICTKWNFDHAELAIARVLGKNVAQHIKLSKLLTPSLSSTSTTDTVVVLGGLACYRRMQMIASLVREVDVIFVGGELCIPFLMAQHMLPLQLVACHRRLIRWQRLAAQLLSEAHRFGTKICLPSELVLCHDDRTLEELREAVRLMPTLDELDIETTVFSVSSSTEKLVPGLICDVTDEFVNRIKEMAQTHSKVVWMGPLGVMEIPNFHHGTEELFSVVSSLHDAHCKLYDETEDLRTADFSHFTAVVGEDLYHWCNVFAELDDGLMLGDGEGVTFATPDSFFVSAILCGSLRQTSLPFAQREPDSGEWLWKFHQKLIAQQLEEEDDDDEDEDESDDSDESDESSSDDEDISADN